MRVVEGEVRVRGTLNGPPALYTWAFRKILVRVVRVNAKKFFSLNRLPRKQGMQILVYFKLISLPVIVKHEQALLYSHLIATLTDFWPIFTMAMEPGCRFVLIVAAPL